MNDPAWKKSPPRTTTGALFELENAVPTAEFKRTASICGTSSNGERPVPVGRFSPD
jgi:hypothetical protein